MPQKTYKEFKSTEGKPLTKTLALPTNERIINFLKELGKQNFTELLTIEGQQEYGLMILNIGVDMEKMKRMLTICLSEPIDDIDVNPSTFDVRLADEVIQDFFDQRAQMFLQRKRN